MMGKKEMSKATRQKGNMQEDTDIILLKRLLCSAGD